MAEEKQEPLDFLRRWSRLKRGDGDLENTGQDAGLIAASAGVPSEPANSETDEEIANREAAEAVDLDSLDACSDFSIFLRRGVPRALRTRALRKLWSTDPVLANLDGLNDYEQTDVQRPSGAVKSLWQAGEGYARQAGDALQGLREHRDASTRTNPASSVSDAPEASAPACHDEAEPAAPSRSSGPASD